MTAVIYADLEQYLCDRFRAELAARGRSDVLVSNREPGPNESAPAAMLIVRDNSGPSKSMISAERDVNLSVLAGTKAAPKPAMDLARLVTALAGDLAGLEPGNPIAHVPEDGVNGPYWVPEDAVYARTLTTVTFVVVGQPL
ncbi:hypothetical protein GCM10009706_14270 [Curtobacterium citreum]|uniref:Tail terminator n=1 Tax=Curtobacterium citreum TaxID=2036 RepID=A0ABT2HDK4_9MICO|nr:hypothetical protein [Curtobacterium citreum]MCS6521346.1 hypothetical protein [Curtobacterium citreum]TQJ28205.1 hypothetical protein FB462_2085 [Curtobacterium citreum]GGL76973.1 hypothetical protein GCM10009706_14270 [Curtobacterium citreum]